MPAAAGYARLLAAEKAAGRGDLNRPFIRGGIWRNFLTRYPEANWMHKRMQALSARLAGLPAAPPEATAELYRAQANDAYWHGLFGGLYLPHLRRAVWNNLVALEARLDALQPRPATVAVDLDFDGKTEVLAHAGDLQVALRDDGLGAAHELDSYPLAHNFGDTLRRYHEHYHDKIGSAESTHDGDGIASAHDIVRYKHPVGVEDIVPDPLPRAIWIDALDGVPVADYRLEGSVLRCTRAGIAKAYAIDDATVSVTWRLAGLAGRRLETRLNLAMPSCDGFLGRYVLADGRIPGGFGQPLDLADDDRLTLEDGVLGGAVRLAASLPATIRARPHQTVSQSEAGFEKIMQAVELTFGWTVPDDDCTLQFHLTIAPRTP
jgi:alpha-amylase